MTNRRSFLIGTAATAAAATTVRAFGRDVSEFAPDANRSEQHASSYDGFIQLHDVNDRVFSRKPVRLIGNGPVSWDMSPDRMTWNYGEWNEAVYRISVTTHPNIAQLGLLDTTLHRERITPLGDLTVHCERLTLS